MIALDAITGSAGSVAPIAEPFSLEKKADGFGGLLDELVVPPESKRTKGPVEKKGNFHAQGTAQVSSFLPHIPHDQTGHSMTQAAQTAHASHGTNEKTRSPLPQDKRCLKTCPSKEPPDLRPQPETSTPQILDLVPHADPHGTVALIAPAPKGLSSPTPLPDKAVASPKDGPTQACAPSVAGESAAVAETQAAGQEEVTPRKKEEAPSSGRPAVRGAAQGQSESRGTCQDENPGENPGTELPSDPGSPAANPHPGFGAEESFLSAGPTTKTAAPAAPQTLLPERPGLENAHASQDRQETARSQATLQSEALVEKATLKIHEALQQGKKEVFLDADPPDLGPVKISLSFDQGELHIHFDCSDWKSYERLSSELDSLKQALTQQGLGHTQLGAGFGGGHGRGDPRDLDESTPWAGRAPPARPRHTPISQSATSALDLVA